MIGASLNQYRITARIGAGGMGEVFRARDTRLNRDVAIKAIELDGTLGEPHAALAVIKVNADWDWAGAEVDFRRAIELSPNYATAHHWLGIMYEGLGRCSEAVVALQRARELDPLSAVITTRTGRTLCTRHRPHRARTRERRQSAGLDRIGG